MTGDTNDRRGSDAKFPLRTSTRKAAETMSTSLSPDELLNQARSGSTEHLGQLLGTLPPLPRSAGPHRDRAEPSGETRRLGPRARHALEAHRNFPRFRGVQRNAIRLLAAADHGGQPGEPPAPLPRHPRPRRPPGTRTGGPLGPVVAAAGPGPGRTGAVRPASRRPAANKWSCWPTPWSSFPKITAK